MKRPTSFKTKIKRFWKLIGPGLVTGASDDDPSGIATYSQAGAQFGLATLWTSIIAFPLMAAIQQMCARIGVFKTKRTLSKIAVADRRFNWLDLEKDIRNAYSRVHIAWDKEDMSAVQEYVSPWYWQNQQLVYLDEWKSRNLHNVCHLKTIGRI